MTSPVYDVLGSSWDMTTLPPGPLADLHAYWQSRRGTRPVPLRRDIDPLEIPRLLPFLMLIEVERLEPLQWRIRLAGTNFRRFFGRDLTGMTQNEADLDGGLAEMCRDWREVLQQGRPRWASVRQEVGRDGMDSVRFTGLALPLSRDGHMHQGQAADMILLGTLYHPE